MELKKRIAELTRGVPANFLMVKEAIKLILKYTGEVSSDDVRFYIKEFTPSSAIVGSAFMALVQEGFVEKQGRKPTDLKSSKGREIAVYKLVQ